MNLLFTQLRLFSLTPFLTFTTVYVPYFHQNIFKCVVCTTPSNFTLSSNLYLPPSFISSFSLFVIALYAPIILHFVYIFCFLPSTNPLFNSLAKLSHSDLHPPMIVLPHYFQLPAAFSFFPMIYLPPLPPLLAPPPPPLPGSAPFTAPETFHRPGPAPPRPLLCKQRLRGVLRG